MELQRLFRIAFAGALTLASIYACSKTEPRLGSTEVVTSIPDGSIVQKDSRSILPSGGLAGEESATVELKAAVVKVDQATRTITLRNADGTENTIVAPPEARNLAQLKAGDHIKVYYRRAASFEVREPTADEIALSGTQITAASRARLGELPGALANVSGISIVTIDSISKEKQLVNIKTADGRIVPIQAKYPENLSLVKPGQKAIVTWGETVVAGVERVQ